MSNNRLQRTARQARGRLTGLLRFARNGLLPAAKPNGKNK